MLLGIDSFDDRTTRLEGRYIWTPGIYQYNIQEGRKYDSLSNAEKAMSIFNSGLGNDTKTAEFGTYKRYVATPSVTAASELIVGFDVRNREDTGSIVDTEVAGASYYQAPNTTLRCAVVPRTSGALRFYPGRPPLTSIAEETAAGVILPDVWQYIEIKFSQTSGITVRREGSVVFESSEPPSSLFGGAFSGFTQAGMAFRRFGLVGWRYDNLYVLDPTSGRYSSFLGPVRNFRSWPKYTVEGSSAALSLVNEHYDDTSGTVAGGVPNVTGYHTMSPSDRLLFKFQHYRPFGRTYAIQLNAWVDVASPRVQDGSIRFVAKSPTGNYYYSAAQPVRYNYLQYSPFAGAPDPTWTWTNVFALWENDPETNEDWSGEALLDWAFGIICDTPVQVRVATLALERMCAVGSGTFSIFDVQ